jgi:hypothetical protein
MATQIADAVALLQTDVNMNYKEAKAAFLKRHGQSLNETTFYAAKRKVKAMGAAPVAPKHAEGAPTPSPVANAADAIRFLNRVDDMARACGGYDGLELFVRSIMEIGGPENIITVIDRLKTLR